jgi:hypothetical protein
MRVAFATPESMLGKSEKSNGEIRKYQWGNLKYTLGNFEK